MYFLSGYDDSCYRLKENAITLQDLFSSSPMN